MIYSPLGAFKCGDATLPSTLNKKRPTGPEIKVEKVLNVINPTIRFLESGQRNAWVNCGPASIYLRRGHHWIDDNMVHCVDIASISMPAKFQRQGRFTKYLGNLTRLLEVDETLRGNVTAIYIENVLNEAFAKHLFEIDFKLVKVAGYSYVPSLYKPLKVQP